MNIILISDNVTEEQALLIRRLDEHNHRVTVITPTLPGKLGLEWNIANLKPDLMIVNRKHIEALGITTMFNGIPVLSYG